MKNIIRNVLLISAFILSVNAHAIMVTTSAEGVVYLDNGGANPFGLSNGDSIFLSATYDDALVTGVSTDEDVAIDGLAGWDFTITLGSFSFTQSDVTDPTWTTFWFDTGAFDGVEFYLEDIDVGSYSGLLIEDFNGGRSLFAEDLATGAPIYLEADWNFADAVTIPVDPTAVTEPSVLLLMMSGLAGMLVFRKRTM